MIIDDEDALICDMAEYYHIYNYREHPLSLIATLACGLPISSRSKQIQMGLQFPLDTILTAHIADELRLIWWSKTEDGVNGINRPASFVEILSGKSREREYKTFTSKEEFKNARDRIIKRVKDE